MPRIPVPERLAVWRGLLTVHANLTEAIDRRLQEAGAVPLRWYDALLCLHEAPGRRLRLSDLAKAALLSRSGLTRLVDRLEDAGLLARANVPEDGRGAVAVLTPAGHEALRKAWAVYGPAIQEDFAGHLSATEVATLRSVFDRVLAANAQTRSKR
jgi:DNA-binding MarR family transcriptional regulator